MIIYAVVTSLFVKTKSNPQSLTARQANYIHVIDRASWTEIYLRIIICASYPPEFRKWLLFGGKRTCFLREEAAHHLVTVNQLLTPATAWQALRGVIGDDETLRINANSVSSMQHTNWIFQLPSCKKKNKATAANNSTRRPKADRKFHFSARDYGPFRAAK